MKYLFLVAVSIAVSAPAFAIHAYRSEKCKSESHTLTYQGNYPIGGSYILAEKNSSSEGIELYEAEGNDAEAGEFKVRNSKVLSSKTKKASCNGEEYDFEETVSKTQKVIEFGASGGNMIFKCEEVFSAPVRCK